MFGPLALVRSLRASTFRLRGPLLTGAWQAALALIVAACSDTVTTKGGQLATATKPNEPVVTPSTPARVRISVSDATLRAIGDSLVPTATVTDRAGAVIAGVAVHWALTSPAPVAFANGSGTVVATAPGTTGLVASVGTLADTVTLTVAPVATRLTVSPPSLAFTIAGQTGQITAAATDARGTPVAANLVSFASSASAVASVAASGLVTAGGTGSAFVRVSSGALRDSVLVTVAAPAPSVRSVRLATHALTADAIGDTLRVSAIARDANGALVSVAITYRALDPAVAMVGSSGNVWVTGPGIGRIVAQAGAYADTAVVTVIQIATALQITPAALTLPTAGQTATLTARVLDGNGAAMAGAPVTWTTANAGVATVTSAGLVTAVANGSTSVRATTPGAAGAVVSATASVQVSAPIVAARLSFVVNAATTTALGDTVRLTARAFDATGAVLAIPITYTASPPLYGSVDASGLVTARAVGTLVVLATGGGKTDSALVTMTQVATRVLAQRQADTVLVGDSVAPTFTSYDSRGATMSAVAALASGSPAVARVSGVRVVGLSVGTATITGTVGSVSAQSVVVVKAPAAAISLIALRNAVPGQTATLVGRGLLNVSTLRIDGAAATPLVRTDSTLTVALASSTCDVDGRLLGISASGNGATATASFPLTVATGWTLGVGESRVASGAQIGCVALPKGDAQYRLSVVNLNRTVDPTTGMFSNSTLFSYRTSVATSPLFSKVAGGGVPSLSRMPALGNATARISGAQRAAADRLLARARVNLAGGPMQGASDLADHRAPAGPRSGLRVDATTTAPFAVMQARLRRSPQSASTARVSRSSRVSGAALTAFDPRMVTGVVGDTVLVPDWFSSTTSQYIMCTQPKADVPTYKAVIYAVNAEGVVLLDTRLAVATTYYASATVRATLTAGLGLVNRTSVPAIQSVITPGYTRPQGAGGRYFAVITPLGLANASGTIFFSEGMSLAICPNASGADFAAIAPGAWNMTAGQFAGVVDHEFGHVADQRYSWTTGRSTAAYGAQLVSQGWMVEALASSVQEQATRIAAGTYLQAVWLGQSSTLPTPQWGIWPDPNQFDMSPWGPTTTRNSTTGQYTLGSQLYTYARQMAGEGGSAAPPTQSLYQRLASGGNWTIDGIAGLVGMTGDAFLDQATLAVLMDDVVSDAAATQYSLPQFTYYTNATLQASMDALVGQMQPDHVWSSTTPMSGTAVVAPGAYGFYTVPTATATGVSVALTPSSGAASSVIRITRVR